jgi:hypothetical protein
LFEVQFDFRKHELNITTSEGGLASRPLRPEPVAEFYRGLFGLLASLEIAVEINRKPQEVGDALPFDQDYAHNSYNAQSANRFWRILVSSSRVLERFRGKFTGKCSPVHFFWGSFDLACTRFSGRPAPLRKGAISAPAYSQEVCSAGFWPGGGAVDGAAYYAYFVPQPPGIDIEPIRPAAAGWNSQLGEFILKYDDVRQAASPEDDLYQFLESTYAAGARVGRWDRKSLEL